MTKVGKTIMLGCILACLGVAAANAAGSGERPAIGQAGEAKSNVVEFTPGKGIEISFSTIKEGKHEQFFKSYLPKVFPLVKEYGGRRLGAMAVLKVLEGDIQSRAIGLYEWPDSKTFQTICRDPRFKKIEGIKLDALSYLNEGNFFFVETKVQVDFHSNEVYLLCAIWLEKQADLNSQMRVNPLMTLKLANDNAGHYAPTAIYIYDMKDAGLEDKENPEQIKHRLFKDIRDIKRFHLVKTVWIVK
jgi:hypothetical protein